jgi:putative ABC transport system permease protein
VKGKIKPPKIALWINRLLLNGNEFDNRVGEYEEVFEQLLAEKGKLSAASWYWSQTLQSIPDLIVNRMLWGGAMLNNYFKIALRNIKKNKGYSTINIMGLAVGIACALLIFMWVDDELSYDSFHTKSDRIYRLCSRITRNGTTLDQAQTPALLPVTLMQDFPEVEQAVKLGWPFEITTQYEDKFFTETDILPVDSTFFDVFSFKLIRGDPSKALNQPLSLVLTEETAERYFGDEEPVGKVITLAGQYPLNVTGVVENIPRNSHFHFDMLLSMITLPPREPGWFNNDFRTYIVLQEGYDYRQLEAKFPDFVIKYLGRGNAGWQSEGDSYEYYLQPLTDIHLTSDIEAEFEPNGNKTYVYIFTITAVFILLIACINFMNLSTSKSASRASEIGIRKVVGSYKRQLVFQFLCESILLSVIALVAAGVLVYLALPHFNNLVGKDFSLTDYNLALIISALTGITLFVGLAGGIFPAFYLSSLKPAIIIKGKLREGSATSKLRNALVVFQFSITIALFIGTFIVGRQLNYLQSKRLGFDKEQVVILKNLSSLGDKRSVFKESLRKYPAISAVAGSFSLPGGPFINYDFYPDDSEMLLLNFGRCEPDFINALKLEMADGRFFSDEIPGDSLALIINETAAAHLQWEEPVGKSLSTMGRRFRVIGVVKDFHYKSLHSTVEPMALFNLGLNLPWPERYIAVRINKGDITRTIEFISDEWIEMTSDKPFEYSFLDEDYNSLYHNEARTGTLFKIFSIIAIFIASLGLIGLASYTAEQRAKEISIRKVCGAGVISIIVLLSKEFLKWVLIANLIAWPAAYFFMEKWLQNFAYKTNIEPETFLIAAVLAAAAAVGAVFYQTISAAFKNPVENLKYE